MCLISTCKPLKQRQLAASSVPVSCLIIAFSAARSAPTQPRITEQRGRAPPKLDPPGVRLRGLSHGSSPEPAPRPYPPSSPACAARTGQAAGAGSAAALTQMGCPPHARTPASGPCTQAPRPPASPACRPASAFIPRAPRPGLLCTPPMERNFRARPRGGISFCPSPNSSG